MKRIGLTGSIGAGKSTVAQILRDRGIPVLDADVIARKVSSFPEVLQEVKNTFGSEYVLENGLNRKKLAELVFQKPSAREQLNAIIHPRVRAEINRQQLALEANGVNAIVQDIPLLFESNLEKLFDAVILVDAPLEIRVARVMARDGISREAVLARDTAQMPATEKRARATIILENSSTQAELEAQIQAALLTLGL